MTAAQPRRRSTHSTSSSASTGSGTGNALPESYVADPTQGPMLRYQASLPHLPVPPLASTLSKYLETLRPHLSPAEYAHSESILRAFGASKQAEELQRRLEARAASDDGVVAVNWLADWWNETAYMAFREPVVVNVSYFYVHAHMPDADEAVCDAPAPKRAARLLKAMLPFRTLVETCVKTTLRINALLMSLQCSTGTREGPRCAALHGFVHVAVSIIRTFDKAR
jgi:carnitine O-acetyltransferase